MKHDEFYERWILMPLVFGILVIVGIPLAIAFSPLWVTGAIAIRLIDRFFDDFVPK